MVNVSNATIIPAGITLPAVTLGGNVTVGDITILPSADNQGQIGSDAYRFNLVRAQTVSSGDLQFDNGWRLTEDDDYGVCLISPEDKKYRMVKV